MGDLTAGCLCRWSTNTTCASATAIPGFPFTDDQDGAAAWYTFTAPTNGRLTVSDARGAVCNATIRLREGFCPAPGVVASATSPFPPRPVTLTADVLAGHTYFVEVAPGTRCGALGVSLSFSPS